MIAIIDYGVGNLFSLRSSFAAIGHEVIVSGERTILEKADKLILPGVGAFEDAVAKLRTSGLDQLVMEKAAADVPLMGICLGMQLLFEKSFEYGEHDGLGLLKGQVVGMSGKLPSDLKIPHMGWNQLAKKKSGKLLENVRDGEFVYFVHSYFAENCDESVAAVTEYGIPLTAAVEKGNIFGCQFHPEKSGEVGLRILKTFSEL